MSTYAIYYQYDIPPAEGLPGAKHNRGVMGIRRIKAANDEDAAKNADAEWAKITHWQTSRILNPRFVSFARELDWKPRQR